MNEDPRLEIERVQTGVRMEKRILKVLKAFAEYHDMTLGDVLEGKAEVPPHWLRSPFSTWFEEEPVQHTRNSYPDRRWFQTRYR